MCLSGVPPFSPSPVDLARWGALVGPLTIGHQWWRMGTAMFLHFGLIHLLMNMVCLLSLGLVIETFFGRASLLIVYLLSGLGGSLLSLLIHPQGVGAGASGAIFGVAGAIMATSAVHWSRQATHPLADEWRQLLSFLTINLGYGIIQPEIDLSAHVGGLLTGAVFGLALIRPDSLERRPTWGRMIAVSAGGVIACLLGSAALAHWRGPPLEVYQEAQYTLAMRVRSEAAAKQAAGERGRRESVLAHSVRKGATTAETFHELGVIYATEGRYEEALGVFQDGLRHSPQDRALLQSLGPVACNLRRFDLAITAESTLATMLPDSEVRLDLQAAYIGQAGLARAEGNPDKARDDYRQVVSIGLGSAYTAEAKRMLDSLDKWALEAKPPAR
jgi:rhomboid protease GluP